MIDWKPEELGNLAKVKGGKRLPKGKMLTDVPNNHPYIRTRDITNNKITIKDLLYVPDDVFPAISRYIVEEGDVIISIVGTIGLCSVIPPKLNLSNLTENCAKIVEIDHSKLDYLFLYYYLISEEGQYKIETRNVGSTQPKLPLYNIKTIPVPLPPLPEQRAIAGVLSSLDDKIDLLHRQNETLEALAQTLFRQWFIEEAEDDWEEMILSDSCDVIDCLHAKKPEEIKPQENSKYLLQVYNIAEGGKVDLSKKYFVSNDDYEEWVRRIELTGGDLFISKTGRVGAIAQIPHYLKAGIGRNLVAIHPKAPFTSEFLKDLMLSNWMNRKIQLNTSDGTILRSLHVKSISALPVIYPGKERIDQYSEMIRPTHRKIMENLRSIEILENLHDTLLPKLMSGEVRVKV